MRGWTARRVLGVANANLLWPIDRLLLSIQRDQLLERVGLLETGLLGFVDVQQPNHVFLLLLHPLRRCNSFCSVNAVPHGRSASAASQRIATETSVLELVCMQGFHGGTIAIDLCQTPTPLHCNELVI